MAGFESWSYYFPAVLLEATPLGLIYAAGRIMVMSPRAAVQVELHPGGSGDGIPLSPPSRPPRPVRQLDLHPWVSLDIHHLSLTKGARGCGQISFLSTLLTVFRGLGDCATQPIKEQEGINISLKSADHNSTASQFIILGAPQVAPAMFRIKCWWETSQMSVLTEEGRK